MINFKQRELSQMLIDKLKTRFPEVEMVDLMESPENPYSLWIKVIMPDDEDREIEARKMASEISADILMDYGYHMLAIAMLKSSEMSAFASAN